jgi:hypothetical protein
VKIKGEDLKVKRASQKAKVKGHEALTFDFCALPFDLPLLYPLPFTL